MKLWAALATVAATLAITGCKGNSMNEIERADPDAYELDVIFCNLNPDPIEGQLGPVAGPGEVVQVRVAITNRDSVTRRFQLRPMVDSGAGVPRKTGPITTDPVKPGATFFGEGQTGVIDTDQLPYTCTVDVWNSVLDILEPLS